MSLTIKPVVTHEGDFYLIYDESVSDLILPQWLDSEYWQKQDKLQDIGQGRGAAWFVSAPNNEYVLRHYRRGGWVARLNRDRYLWHGLEQTRAWREWRLLAKLTQSSLPTPRPVAARVKRQGLFYTADLLTQRIPDTRSLSYCLDHGWIGNDIWVSIGETVKRFHAKGIYHADLNAHNILLNTSSEVYLIDFDKGCERGGDNWKKANLARLRRSLDKLTLLNPDFGFKESCWQSFMIGYQGGM